MGQFVGGGGGRGVSVEIPGVVKTNSLQILDLQRLASLYIYLHRSLSKILFRVGIPGGTPLYSYIAGFQCHAIQNRSKCQNHVVHGKEVHKKA